MGRGETLPAEDDRRENLVQATPESLEIKDDINDLALRAVEKITEGIPRKDLETFITVLSRMASNMDAGIDLQEMARKFPTRQENNPYIVP